MKASTRLHGCNCFAVRQAARNITRFYERHLADVDLTSAQFSILVALDEQSGRAMNELARALGMDRTTLLRAMQPLQRDGLVNGAAGIKDARQLVFSLTRAGEQKFKEAARLWRQAQREFEALMGTKRAARMRRDLLMFSRED